MTTVPGQLIWEVVKRNNCFLVKEFGNGNAGVQFSKEPNNLYNLNSYKYSGIFLQFYYILLNFRLISDYFEMILVDYVNCIGV